MSFAAPLALLGLLPWAALAWWLWRGRGQRTTVPFLHLWPSESATLRWRRRPPPAPILLVLLALLLAIIAAGRPVMGGDGAAAAMLRIIVDRGATMSAEINGQTRLQRGPREHRDLIQLARRDASVVFVPPLTAGDAATELDAAPPMAADTASPLRALVRERLADGDSVLLISDRDIRMDSPRLFQIGPRDIVPNSGVLDAAVGKDAVLVTLTNAGPTASVTVSVEAGEAVVQQQVELPADGQAQVTLRRPGGEWDWVRVQITSPQDAWAGDDAFVVAREHAWPDLQVSNGAPPAVARVARLFEELHAPRPWSRVLRISAEPTAEAVVAAAVRPAGGAWQVAAHRLTEGIDWPALQNAVVADLPGEGDWQVLAHVGQHPVLAISDSPAGRRAWIGFSADGIEQSPEFVRFWADVLTWLNDGPERWGWRPLSQAELAGLHRDQSFERIRVEPTGGGPVAWNLLPVRFDSAPSWTERALESWVRRHRAGTALGPWLLVGTMVLIVAAAWLWPRR